MKRIIALILMLACVFALSACIFNRQNNNEEGEPILGEITETPAEKGIFWEHADSSVMNSLNAEFDAKKALTDGFYNIPAVSGTTYYISSVNGSDSANGKSATSAWKNLSKLSTASLKAGDAVLFECGSIFRGTVKLVSGVTYASYGSGAKPVFYGSINASDTSNWKAVSGVKNLYQYATTISSSSDIGSIVFNGGEAWGIKIQQLKDADMSLALENVSNGIKTFKNISSFELSDGKDIGKNAKIDLAYYQDGTRLYLYCEGGNPAERFSSIELSKPDFLFSGSNITNVIIANICFKNAGRHAIRTQVCDNLQVFNCSFEFIGGSVHGDDQTFGRNYDTRLGNAIENWNECKGMTVENCYFNQIYDTAMTTQSNTDGTDMVNISYNNNVIENTVYAIELWSSGAADAKCDFKNISIEGNVCRNLGYGMTTQRPDKVSGFLSAKGQYYVYENAVVQNNIINGSIDWIYRTNNIKTDKNQNGYVINNNVYVNDLNNDIGMLSSQFPGYSSEIAEYKYDCETVKKMIEAGVETNGKFYYTCSEDEQLLNSEIISTYAMTAPSYTYKLNGETDIPFRLIFPKGYDSSKQYKLFVYLNYEYANGTDNLKNVQLSSELLGDVYVNGEYILLVPQCPSDTWTGLKVENGNYSTSNVEESGIMRSVYNLIINIADKYNTSSVYAVGVSAGGYAVADLVARHENLLTAAVIIAGAGDTGASIGNTKVWVIHGEGDQKIPVSNAKELSTAWGAEYTEVSRELHDCWTAAFAKEDIVGWLNKY